MNKKNTELAGKSIPAIRVVKRHGENRGVSLSARRAWIEIEGMRITVGAKVDITGQKFGMLTAIEPTDQRKNKKIVWRCLCDCGREVFATAKDLRSGNTQTCGKHGREDLTGQRFGRLTALYLLEEMRGRNACWHCRCDCGNEIDVPTRYLKSGNTRSCGCLNRESRPTPSDTIEGTRTSSLGDKPPVTNTSGVRGVSWSKRDKKWEAYIKFKGTFHHLGHYRNIDDAAKARKRAEEKYFQPFLDELEKTDENP